VLPTKQTFAVVAEEWFKSKRKLRPWTRKAYRATLDNVLLPRFGSTRVAAITTRHVADLIIDLERQGLSSSTIENYLLPLSGTLSFALAEGLISANACLMLSSDQRPERRVVRTTDHVWSDEEIEALIRAADRLARQPASRYDYAPLLRVACFTGLRLGELLGLQ
jgi:integrase